MNNKYLKLTKEYLGISLGLIIYAFGFTSLLVNAGVVGGGAGGISTLLYFAISDKIPVGVYYFLVNLVLITIGIITIGPNFGAKTIYAIIFNSLCLSIMQLYIPKDLLGLDPNTDKLIMAILGGVCSGIGIAICFMQGGSSGGTDIIAMMLNKYLKVPIGRGIMFCDVIIVSSSYFVFHEVKPIVYGFVTLAVVAYTIDAFLTGTKQSVKILIFSKNYKQIGERILKESKRGFSYIDGVGGYTGNDIKIILVLCRRNEQAQISKIIREEDPHAFVSIGSVTNVLGEGFESLDA